MARIQLNHAEMSAIAFSMKSKAGEFQSNHSKLLQTASSLNSNFKGRIPDMMCESLREMNKGVDEIQKTLAALSDLALNAANILQEADRASGKIISG